VIEDLRAHDGELPAEAIRGFAEKAFKRTAAYDRAIVDYLEGR
jgi:AICAR transformylase/IMP cyclohydrolase PurH